MPNLENTEGRGREAPGSQFKEVFRLPLGSTRFALYENTTAIRWAAEATLRPRDVPNLTVAYNLDSSLFEPEPNIYVRSQVLKEISAKRPTVTVTSSDVPQISLPVDKAVYATYANLRTDRPTEREMFRNYPQYNDFLDANGDSTRLLFDQMPDLMEHWSMQARFARILKRMTFEGILEARQVMQDHRDTRAKRVARTTGLVGLPFATALGAGVLFNADASVPTGLATIAAERVGEAVRPRVAERRARQREINLSRKAVLSMFSIKPIE